MSDMSGTKAQALERYARARGQAYLRFDYQGHGVSSGRFEDGTIGLWAADAVAALDGASAGPQILVGSSMGGWIMLLAALARPERVAAASMPLERRGPRRRERGHLESAWSLIVQKDGHQVGPPQTEQLLAELEPLFKKRFGDRPS